MSIRFSMKKPNDIVQKNKTVQRKDRNRKFTNVTKTFLIKNLWKLSTFRQCRPEAENTNQCLIPKTGTRPSLRQIKNEI